MTLAAFLSHIAFAIALFCMSMALTWLMANWGGVMDLPNERSSHTRPVPKSGGIAIVITFVMGSLAIFGVSKLSRIDDWYFISFIGGAVLLAVASFVDDVTQSSFVAKIAAQATCAVLVIAAGLVIDRLNLPFLGEASIGWLGYVLTFLWLVGLTNTLNFMDGLDGLAAGVALIAGGFLCGIAFSQDSVFVYLSSYTLLAGVAGFIVFNWAPARIFMGDVGSAFLGFVFATLAVIGASLDRGHLSFYVVPLLFFQFIFDAIFTVVRRALRGEPLHLAHRSHLYQLLNQLGYSHLQVTVFYCLVAVIQGVGAVILTYIDSRYKFWVFMPFLLCNIIYARWILLRAKKSGLIKHVSTRIPDADT